MNLCVCSLELIKSKENAIFMRPEDTLLDLEEAEALATQMYGLLGAIRNHKCAGLQ
jgi:hypothetical protein